MKLLKTWLVLVSFFLMGSAVADVPEPQRLLQEIANRMVLILKDNKEQLAKDPNYASQIVRENLLPLIDTDGIGKRLLKRSQWAQLSEEQQVRFNNAFIEHLIQTYAQGLAHYDDHQFVFEQTRFSRTGKTAWVYSELVAKDYEKFDIIYTLKTSDEYQGWKVIDIAVNGIKILQNYREQLKTVDLTDGFDALLAKIEAEQTNLNRSTTGK